jgi:hypothetical protein
MADISPEFNATEFIATGLDPIVSGLTENLGITGEQARQLCITGIIRQLMPEIDEWDTYQVSVSTVAGTTVTGLGGRRPIPARSEGNFVDRQLNGTLVLYGALGLR